MGMIWKGKRGEKHSMQNKIHSSSFIHLKQFFLCNFSAWSTKQWNKQLEFVTHCWQARSRASMWEPPKPGEWAPISWSQLPTHLCSQGPVPGMPWTKNRTDAYSWYLLGLICLILHCLFIFSVFTCISKPQPYWNDWVLIQKQLWRLRNCSPVPYVVLTFPPAFHTSSSCLETDAACFLRGCGRRHCRRCVRVGLWGQWRFLSDRGELWGLGWVVVPNNSWRTDILDSNLLLQGWSPSEISWSPWKNKSESKISVGDSVVPQWFLAWNRCTERF